MPTAGALEVRRLCEQLIGDQLQLEDPSYRVPPLVQPWWGAAGDRMLSGPFQCQGATQASSKSLKYWVGGSIDVGDVVADAGAAAISRPAVAIPMAAAVFLSTVPPQGLLSTIPPRPIRSPSLRPVLTCPGNITT
jgi:hypothetical protein